MGTNPRKPGLLFTSPFFGVRPNFLFEHPGVARLLVKRPIGASNGFRPHQLFGFEIGQGLVAAALPDPAAHPGRVDAGIDHEMGNVKALRSKLAGDRLRDGA
jgi:hypothetical protein